MSKPLIIEGNLELYTAPPNDPELSDQLVLDGKDLVRNVLRPWFGVTTRHMEIVPCGRVRITVERVK